MPMVGVVRLMSLMLQKQIICDVLVLEMVKFKLNDMNIWSEIGDQLKSS